MIGRLVYFLVCSWRGHRYAIERFPATYNKQLYCERCGMTWERR